MTLTYLVVVQSTNNYSNNNCNNNIDRHNKNKKLFLIITTTFNCNNITAVTSRKVSCCIDNPFNPSILPCHRDGWFVLRSRIFDRLVIQGSLVAYSEKEK